MKKLIGLTGPSSFTSECISMIENYFDANFVLVYHNNSENIAEWVDKVDGFVLGGGNDLHPSLYSQPVYNNRNLSKFDIDRDIREISILDECIKKQIPVLGICRGHQLIGVYHNMTLVSDILDGDIVHAPHKQGIAASKNEPMHLVKLLGDRTKKFFGSDIKEREKIEKCLPKLQKEPLSHIYVNSYHHQALLYEATKDKRKWDEGVLVLGTAEVGLKDCNEIVELMRGKTWISCQWHPEVDYDVNTPSLRVLEQFNSMLDERIKAKTIV